MGREWGGVLALVWRAMAEGERKGAVCDLVTQTVLRMRVSAARDEGQ